MSKVYKVLNDGETSQVRQVRVRNEGAELQRLLERNLDLLPGEQIDPDDPRRWLLVKREMPVPDPGSGAVRWSIDFLLLDQDATPTFVECKRFNDTRARREVVGQMLEYVANGHHYWTGDALRELAEETAAKHGGDLEQAITSMQTEGDLSVEGFFEQAELNLREGQVRLVFFLEESPWELKSIVDFLNKQMERSEVLLVEARQFEVDGTTFVEPTLFGYTEEARLAKRTVRLAPKPGQRRKWDEEAFFADAEARLDKGRLNQEQLAAMHDLYSAATSDRTFGISWGTGSNRGSFNVSLPQASQRSFFSVYSNGRLNVNLEWLSGSDAAEALRAKVFEFAVKGLELPIGPEATYPSCQVSHWAPRVGLIKRFLAELRSPVEGVTA